MSVQVDVPTYIKGSHHSGNELPNLHFCQILTKARISAPAECEKRVPHLSDFLFITFKPTLWPKSVNVVAKYLLTTVDRRTTDIDIDAACNVLGAYVETGRGSESRHWHACYPIAPHGFVDDGIEVRKPLCIIECNRTCFLLRKVSIDFFFEFRIATTMLE